MQVITRASEAMRAQRGHLVGWVPVCLGVGIGLWFSLTFEPGIAVYLLLVAVILCAVAAAMIAPEAVSPLLFGVAIVAFGAVLAGARAHHLAAPKLDFRYYGGIEGRIIKIDRSASDAVRLTLDQVRLDRTSAARTPARVRVALHGEQGDLEPAPGQIVVLSGHLSAPGGPVEPGGFDFARHAWFNQLGAVGYTRSPVLLLRPPQQGAALLIHRWRSQLSTGLRDALPGQTGAVAAAIVTGDRSAIDAETQQNLRHANLAHLLAISGLHMGLLTGFIFAALRYGLALLPVIALTWPTKKLAAGAALGVGAVYLLLSGGSVATERAFIMVSVMLVAVILDRRALTLRAVAIAAIVVLIRRPEELMGPGFQMSFAATTALVVAFGALRDLDLPRLPWWGRNVGGVFLSSLVAGLATAPFAAAHFNLISHYGLIANMLAVPVMGLLVMPCAVLAACLWPLGLSGIGLWAMGKGLEWILWVAETVSRQPGAIGHVPSPHPSVLPVLALGLLAFALWHGRARSIALVSVPVALTLWVQTPRPDILITPSGGLMGVLTPEGRVLSRERGEGFAALSWLENDGHPVSQSEAAQREGLHIDGKLIVGEITGTGYRVLQARGTRARDELQGCNGADILILDTDDTTSDRPCVVLDAATLRTTGAVAAYALANGDLALVSTHDLGGLRMWSAHTAAQTAPAGPVIVAANDRDEPR